MINNKNILKQAVKTALLLLAVGAQANAHALGLGNIEVKSLLGQPLRASVKVQGASELKSTNCLSVINDESAENQITNAGFKLSKVVDDVAILTITTKQVLTEPIVNLSILAECDANIRRDYVLLLDPPTVSNTEATTDNSLNNELADDVSDLNEATVVEKSVNKSAAANTQTIKAKRANKKASGVKTLAKNKADSKNIVLTAGYDKTDITPQTETTQKQIKPRLSVSGGDFATNTTNSTKLMLDKQLRFTPDNAPVALDKALAEDSDIQDEVTVMNNRMAHLTRQINTLALANENLKAENESKAQLIATDAEKGKLDWLGYILGGALLFSSFSIASKWRERRQYSQFDQVEANFTDSKPSTHLVKADINDEFFDLNKNSGLNSEVEESTKHFDLKELEAEFIKSSPGEPAAEFSVEEFNAEHNILDHADVFLSHGRTSLAIQLLQNHLIDHPKQSVTIWLFLLDLLAQDNMQAMYEQTALECKEHFNIRIAAFSNDEASPKQHLDDFPRLSAGLEQIWGTPAAVVFLDDLIYNSRLENRVGFEKSVIEELLLLKSIAHETASSAQVIQLDDKKIELKAQKEAQLAASKEERMKKINDEIEQKAAESRALAEKEANDSAFEFTLAEYN